MWNVHNAAALPSGGVVHIQVGFKTYLIIVVIIIIVVVVVVVVVFINYLSFLVASWFL